MRLAIFIFHMFSWFLWPQSSANSQTFINNYSKSDYTIKNFSPRDGLGSLQTRGIVQDAKGFIWIGSRDLISRFDGYNFKIYKFEPASLSKSSYTGGLLNLYTDRKKNVWVLSEYFSRFDQDADDFIHYKPKFALSTVTRVSFGRDNKTIWFGTTSNGLYSYDISSDETNHYSVSSEEGQANTLNNSIRGVSDIGEHILVATLKGLWLFDKDDKVFVRPKCSQKDAKILHEQAIWSIIDSPHANPDDTWVYTTAALVCLDRNVNISRTFPFPLNFQSYTHTRDNSGKFYFVTPDGFYQYNPLDGSSGYINIDRSLSATSGQIYVDREQNIWSGTQANGVFQFAPRQIIFSTLPFDTPATWTTGATYHTNGMDYIFVISSHGQKNSFWNASPITSSNTDSVIFRKQKIAVPLQGLIINSKVTRDTFWACSWMSGIMAFPIDTLSGIIDLTNPAHFLADPEQAGTIRPFVSAMYEDRKGNIWTASRGFGVSVIDMSKRYGEEGSVIHFMRDTNNVHSLSNNYCWDFFKENEDAFWIINWGGIDLFRNGKFEHIFTTIKKPRSMLKISDDTLIVGTYEGIYEAVRDGNSYTLIDSASIKNHLAYNMILDSAGRVWFYDPKKNELICYDRTQRVPIEFNEEDGLPTGIHFLSQSSRGIMVLGSTSGLTLFDPRFLKIDKRSTYPALTRLTVNNEVPSIKAGHRGSNNLVLNKDISALRELNLDHEHNNFSIEFSAMEFIAPDRNLYRHRLEGYDDNWIETDANNRTATYTNLNPGTYTFRVTSSNHHGIWSHQEATLSISILPPPWKTWWAYTLYGLAFIAIIICWRQYDIKRVRLQHRAEHLSELDALKTRFFANISHEFRTPITLILGPLKTFHEKAYNTKEKQELAAMMRNGKRLLRLINQLLDLSKLEAGKMQLHARRVDVVRFIQEVAASYESLAVTKAITFCIYSEVPEIYSIRMDPEKIEKVLHNLLSNAFKFTGEGGEVVIHISRNSEYCLIKVADTGIGIPAEEIDKVFDRFYQVDSSQTRAYEGSGLGMALAKELIELHNGTINVKSMEGKGTTFTVALPSHHETPDDGQTTAWTHTKEYDPVTDAIVHEENEPQITESREEEKLPLVLVVEDNADMRAYIRKIMAEHYRILEASNGKSGLESAKEKLPDLIISDIMMPVMDGVQLCSLVKKNELTSHIPVILLTAKADQESKLAGLETGADDYLSKPFDANELRLLVRNRIEERRKMQEHFGRHITLEPARISINSTDERFITGVMNIIEKHMDDEQFSIDILSREAGFSNMQFYRKIKALTGNTPGKFLMTIRLKRAAQLLANNHDNVSHIAYSVGFSSLSYFTKCFKEHFGVTPGNFRKSPSIERQSQ